MFDEKILDTPEFENWAMSTAKSMVDDFIEKILYVLYMREDQVVTKKIYELYESAIKHMIDEKGHMINVDPDDFRLEIQVEVERKMVEALTQLTWAHLGTRPDFPDQNWSLAKLGVGFIKRWAKEQSEIDGDSVQVEEIMAEWTSDIVAVARS